MTEHPITPPPELVKQWASEFYGTPIAPGEAAIDIATQAARWGADMELEACLRLVEIEVCDGAYELSRYIRTTRRPKPPSLKEQALQALALLKVDASTHGLGFDSSAIRRALESLPD